MFYILLGCFAFFVAFCCWFDFSYFSAFLAAVFGVLLICYGAGCDLFETEFFNSIMNFFVWFFHPLGG